jgi:hypothetical protein
MKFPTKKMEIFEIVFISKSQNGRKAFGKFSFPFSIFLFSVFSVECSWIRKSGRKFFSRTFSSLSLTPTPSANKIFQSKSYSMLLLLFGARLFFTSSIIEKSAAITRTYALHLCSLLFLMLLCNMLARLKCMYF